MRSAEKKVLIQKALSELDNSKRFKELINFINENHKLVKQFRGLCSEKILIGAENENDKLIAFFIDSINAGGVGRLEDKNESLNIFEEKLPDYKNNFDKMIDDLFIKKKVYKQLGLKKSALFIESTHYHTNIIPENILTKNSDKITLPIDVVICCLLAYMLPKEEYEKIMIENSDELKKQLTQFAIQQFGNNYSDFVKLDDLWFWGHFTARRKGKIISTLEVNKTQINLEPLIRKNKKEIQTKCQDFIQIVNKTKEELRK